jgi:hypothetical protein
VERACGIVGAQAKWMQEGENMVKAIIKKGVFVPQEPLPSDWTEGVEVEVDRPLPSPQELEELDRWYAELEALAAQGDPEDDARLERALAEVRQQEKDLARKQLGLD